MDTNPDNNDNDEIDLCQIMVTKVRSGNPVQVAMPTTEPLLRLHLSMITRLRAETGMPVHVIYN